MKYPVFVSFIVYARDGADKIAGFLAGCDDYLHGKFDCYEIIVVNDGSRDSTQAEVEKAARGLKGNLILINLPWRHGVEPAMTAGLHRSVGDFVYEADTIDLDCPFELFGQMYETAVLGFDIVSGASASSRSMASSLFYRFINRVSYADLNMSTETVRLSSRRALNAMLNLKEKFRYRKALYLLTGYPNRTVVYKPLPGRGGVKSRNRQESLSLALDVIIGFSNIGIKSIHFLSGLMFLFSVFIVFYTLHSYFFVENVVEGWLTIMLFLSIVFSGLFFILGVLGEYIMRILDEVKGRPYYTISSVKIFSETANALGANGMEGKD